MGVALLYSGVNGNGYRESNNGNDIDDVILKTHWAPTDVDDFSLNFHYYDASADMPGGLTQAQYDADPFQSDRNNDNFSGRRKDVSFKWARQIDDRTQAEVLIYYTDSFRGSNIAARDQKTLGSYPAHLLHLRHRTAGVPCVRCRPDHPGSQRRLSLPERSHARGSEPPGAGQQRAGGASGFGRPCVSRTVPAALRPTRSTSTTRSTSATGPSPRGIRFEHIST